MKTFKVHGYTRTIKGKKYKVKPHKRHKRKVGKKVIKFVPIGKFMVGHDKYGNIIKSKVVKPKKRRKKK